MKEKMKEYFVLYKRDRDGEKSKRAKGNMLYDKIKEFKTEEEAMTFGLEYLHDTPIMAKRVTKPTDYEPNATYVLAAYYAYKYKHYCYDGSSDSVPTHEVAKSDLKNLGTLVEKLSEQGPQKIYLGIEKKIIPGG